MEIGSTGMPTMQLIFRIMRKSFIVALVTACVSISATHGAVVSIVGDEDALGTGVFPGGTLPVGPFDNRSSAELVALDGSQNTDLATSSSGVALDAEFIHTFVLIGFTEVGGAVLELGIGGLQSNDSDPNTSTVGEDALRIDGVLIPEAFVGIDQTPLGYGILTVHLPGFILPEFHDGQVRVSIDLNSNAGLSTSTRVEPVFYDFSRLTITEIPEPSTAWLIVAGGFLLLGRKLKHEAASAFRSFSRGSARYRHQLCPRRLPRCKLQTRITPLC